MAVKCSGYRFVSTSGGNWWNNQSVASWLCTFKLDPSSSLASADLNTCYPTQKESGKLLSRIYVVDSTPSGSYTVDLQGYNDTVGFGATLNWKRGVIYQAVMTWQPGNQVVAVNAVNKPLKYPGTIAGNTPSDTSALDLGFAAIPSGSATGPTMIIDNLAIWNGYALTDQDKQDLFTGAKRIDQVGASAPERWWWPLTPPSGKSTGSVVANTDLGPTSNYTASGLTEYFGSGKNFGGITGDGSMVYADSLGFEVSVNTVGYAGTSGKSIIFLTRSIADDSLVQPSSIFSLPTLKVNGVSKGSLRLPFVDAYHYFMQALPPVGTTIAPGDTLSLTAPQGWAVTESGLVSAMSDTAITNYTGQLTATNGLTPTQPYGWNLISPGISTADCGTIWKNWTLRCSNWRGIDAYDANGYPTTINAASVFNGVPYAYAPIYSVISQNGYDNTLIPPPSGDWLVLWQENDAAHPTTCKLQQPNYQMVTLTEVGSQQSSGSLRCRTFNFTYNGDFGEGANGGNYEFRLWIENASFAPRISDIWVCEPGDWDPANPFALDRSDRFAIGTRWKGRLANGVGCVRGMELTNYSSGQTAAAEPEDWPTENQFSFGLVQGFNNGEKNTTIYPATIQPLDLDSSQVYFYSSIWGPAVGGAQYPVTLSGAITTLPAKGTLETITVVWDAANPVMHGQRLSHAGELIRIITVSVSGGTATCQVERGACNTPTAAHAAGMTMQCQYRWPVPQGANKPGGQWWLLSTPDGSPHNFNSGSTVRHIGSWPVLSFPDGSSFDPTGAILVNFNTGISTWAVQMSRSAHGLFTTLASPVSLASQSPASGAQVARPDQVGLPYSAIAKMVRNIPGKKDLTISVPHAATDSWFHMAAQQLLANWPNDGSYIYLEYSNEVWNRYLPQAYANFVFDALFFPGRFDTIHSVWRNAQLKSIFLSYFQPAGRGGQIRSLINVQSGGAFDQIPNTLNYGIEIGSVADSIWTAPYQALDYHSETFTMLWTYPDEAVIDHWTANLFYGSVGARGLQQMALTTSYITDWMASNPGYDVVHCGYEGDAVGVYTVNEDDGRGTAMYFVLSADVDASTTSFPVTLPSWWGDLSPVVAGIPLLVNNEWVVTTGVSGLNILVTRAVNGTTAASHLAGSRVSCPNHERSHDIMYNPQFAFAQKEWMGLVQQVGYSAFGGFFFSGGLADVASWFGVYHAPQQDYGKGDGSDGKANNLLCMATPLTTHHKAANVNQEITNVSVRGQAFLDWQGSLVTTPATSYTFTAPSPPTGYVGQSSGPFILHADGVPSPALVVTPSTDSGTFSPSSPSISDASTHPTYYTPTVAGKHTIVVTHTGGGFTGDPAPVIYTAMAMPTTHGYRWVKKGASFRLIQT